MKKICITLLVVFCIISGNSRASLPASGTTNDTASYPYWVQMMQDPSVNFFKVQRAFNLYWQNRPISKGCGWKAFKRWEYMMQSRVSVNGERPAPELFEQAIEQFDRGTTSTNGNWVPLGPATIPLPGPAGYEGLGRINTIGFHPTDPNKFYIGSPSGGMWQTTDGGATWATHTDTLPTLGVSAIIIDYSSPNTIFIGTGDRDAGDASGLGVYKSTNGGLTWAPSKAGMGDKVVGRMIQDPTNPQIMIAATNGGIYRTTDGGNNWSQTQTGNFKCVEFKPTDHTIVYANGGSQFYRSSNNGASFTLVTSGLGSGQRSTIAVSNANPGYVYVLFAASDNGFGGLYRSTDSGLTFSLRSSSPPNILDYTCDGSGSGGQGWYDLAVAADQTDGNKVFVGGVDVWKSTDGGATWAINSHWYGGCSVPSVHADCHFLGFAPTDNQLYAGNDGGVFSTTNGGTTWNYKMVGVTVGQIYKLGQAQLSKNHVINGFQDNGTYTLSPAGWFSTGGGDGMECLVDYSDDSYTYYTIYYGDIYRRKNNSGEVHIAGNGINGITESGGWVTPFTLSATTPTTMFIGYKNIWRSTNVRPGNPTWQKISDNLAGNNNSDMTDVESSAADPNLLFASRSDNHLFRSDNCLDPNPAWTDLTSSLPVAGTPADLALHPTDPDIVYMVLGNGVYKSVNKGASWTNISLNLPAVHMNSIAYYRNDSEGLYVSTDAGVYFKNSTMAGWIPFNKGLPGNAKITEVEIYYDNDSVSSDVIRGSSYGRGLWSSDMYQAAPVANFTSNKTTVTAGCSIDFTDLSSGVPTNWQWTFTGAIPSSSNLKNPSGIYYYTPGTYPVTLKVWNSNGADSVTRTNYIVVSPAQAPAVDFTANKTVLCEGDVVQFTDQSDNCPGSWTWEIAPSTYTFVQGTSANDENPVVQFTTPCLYTVRLTASNSTGSGSLTKVNYIAYGGYTLPFTEGFESGFDSQHWSVQNPDNDKTWDTITVAGTSPGHLAAWINLYNYSRSTRDQLVSPPLNFSSYHSLTLSFEHAYAQHSTVKDSLIVKISPDCGSSWTRILAAGPDGTPNVFATHSNMSTQFFPESAYDWCGSAYGTDCYSIDISPWAGMANVKIQFESYNRKGNNLFLDNVMISGPVGVPEISRQVHEITIYPNPTTGIVNLFLADPSESVSLSVINVQGQQEFANTFSARSGNTEKQFNLSGLPGGVYFMKVTTDHATTTKKVVLN